MTAREFLNGTEITNIRVDFYCGSYQFAEPKHYSIQSLDEFADAKKYTENYLKHCKGNSTSEAQKDQYWATFRPEGKAELFEERVKI